MRALYGAVLALGVLGLLGWVAASSVAGTVAGWEWLDPERLGGGARRALAAALAFGLGGLSAAFAGWPPPAALGAALAGAAAGAWYAGRFGPGE